jgi:hypothetical protein
MPLSAASPRNRLVTSKRASISSWTGKMGWGDSVHGAGYVTACLRLAACNSTQESCPSDFECRNGWIKNREERADKCVELVNLVSRNPRATGVAA